VLICGFAAVGMAVASAGCEKTPPFSSEAGWYQLPAPPRPMWAYSWEAVCEVGAGGSEVLAVDEGAGRFASRSCGLLLGAWFCGVGGSSRRDVPLLPSCLSPSPAQCCLRHRDRTLLFFGAVESILRACLAACALPNECVVRRASCATISSAGASEGVEKRGQLRLQVGH
jgi:hypothetical protein